MLSWFKKKTGPPDAALAIRRLIILKYQVVSGLATPPPDIFAEIMKSWSEEDRNSFVKETKARNNSMIQSLHQNGLWDEMTTEERKFMQDLPTVDMQQLVNASWLMESAACLLWALGYLDELPPYDSQADVDLLKLLPAESPQNLTKSATFRTSEEIVKARDVAELWHWRSRTRKLQQRGQFEGELPNGLSFEEIIRMTAEGAAGDGVLPKVIDNDFPAFGKPYREISEDEWSMATSIAMERHRAFNWLNGMATKNRWEETPTDT